MVAAPGKVAASFTRKHMPPDAAPAAIRPLVAPTWLRVILVIIVVLVLWRVSNVALLVFASVVLAVVFRMLAEALTRYLPMPDRLALVLVALVIAVLLGAAAYLFGDTVRSQMSDLLRRLPDAWDALRERVVQWELAPQLLEWLDGKAPDPGAVAAQVGVAATSTMVVIGHAVLVLVGALYFAAQPGIYRRGLIALVPAAHQVRAGRVLNELGESLQSWLKGQLVAMLLVGLLIGVGAALIGLPSAIALGLLAGLAEFVPIVGPIVAAVPALLLAATLGWPEVLWTVALFVTVQQIEGNLLMPAIMQKAVALPAAVTLFAVLAFGVLFGPLGILLATPLAVALMVLIDQLYLQND